MKNLLILIFALIILSGCKDNFLELYPKATLSEGSFYQTEVELILLANGCYVPMRDYEKNQHWILAELISDNASFQGTGVLHASPTSTKIEISNSTRG